MPAGSRTAGFAVWPARGAAGWGLEDDIAAITWNDPGMLLAATRNGTVRALDPGRP